MKNVLLPLHVPNGFVACLRAAKNWDDVSELITVQYETKMFHAFLLEQAVVFCFWPSLKNYYIPRSSHCVLLTLCLNLHT